MSKPSAPTSVVALAVDSVKRTGEEEVMAGLGFANNEESIETESDTPFRDQNSAVNWEQDDCRPLPSKSHSISCLSSDLPKDNRRSDPCDCHNIQYRPNESDTKTISNDSARGSQEDSPDPPFLLPDPAHSHQIVAACRLHCRVQRRLFP